MQKGKIKEHAIRFDNIKKEVVQIQVKKLKTAGESKEVAKSNHKSVQEDIKLFQNDMIDALKKELAESK